AYILIGSCCALSVLCLIIVAISVRFKDMCDEYRSWKTAEKAAIRWQLQHRLRMLPGSEYLFPGGYLSKGSRFNLPRYFRTNIGDDGSHRRRRRKGKRPVLPRMYLNKSERMLNTILNATKPPEV